MEKNFNEYGSIYMTSKVQPFQIPLEFYDLMLWYFWKYFKRGFDMIYWKQNEIPNDLKYNSEARMLSIHRIDKTRRLTLKSLIPSSEKPIKQTIIHVPEGLFHIRGMDNGEVFECKDSYSYIIDIPSNKLNRYILDVKDASNVVVEQFFVTDEGLLHEMSIDDGNHVLLDDIGLEDTLIIDTEFGISIYETNQLLSVTIINGNGQVLLDTNVAPRLRMASYNTMVTGLRQKDIIGQPDEWEVISLVSLMIRGKRIVGAGLQTDLEILNVNPMEVAEIIDLNIHPDILRMTNWEHQSIGLKNQARLILGKSIQNSFHSSAEDANTILEIYRKLLDYQTDSDCIYIEILDD